MSALEQAVGNHTAAIKCEGAEICSLSHACPRPYIEPNYKHRTGDKSRPAINSDTPSKRLQKLPIRIYTFSLSLKREGFLRERERERERERDGAFQTLCVCVRKSVLGHLCHKKTSITAMNSLPGS